MVEIKKSKIELLAPAGDFTNLKVAIDAGADAVYFGLKEFSLRAGRKNFELNDLEKIKKICEEKGVKRYLTLNSIIYEEELTKLEKIIKKISEKNLIDAVICWDLSVVRLCKKYNLPFHISTQASVSNSESVKFYQNLGATKIVLARELNLKQIRKIIGETGIDAEVFVHGAMCVAISGRCLTSQFLFGKSANRGRCLHPCRRSYIVKDKQEGYELEVQNDKIFSAKDLCALPFMDKLISNGIKSFKIEGRNRDPRYVGKVVEVYKKAINLIESGEKFDNQIKKNLINELEKVYNKGFSSGFYFGVPTSDDFSNTEHSQSKEKKNYVGKIKHYYPNKQVAEVLLSSNLKIGNKISIIGEDTGIVEFEIKSMEIDNKKIKKASSKQLVGIELPSAVRKGDEVYIIESVEN